AGVVELGNSGSSETVRLCRQASCAPAKAGARCTLNKAAVPQSAPASAHNHPMLLRAEADLVAGLEHQMRVFHHFAVHADRTFVQFAAGFLVRGRETERGVRL